MSWEETSPEQWVKAVHGLPPEPLKFAVNASLGTLPTNANLHTVGQEDQRHLQPVQGTSAVSHPYPQQLLWLQWYFGGIYSLERLKY